MTCNGELVMTAAGTQSEYVVDILSTYSIIQRTETRF